MPGSYVVTDPPQPVGNHMENKLSRKKEELVHLHYA